MVARVAERKGHREFLSAAAKILAGNKILLLVVGDGPLMNEMRAFAKELGIDDCVIFTGKRSDMPSVYAAMDVVVLPSFEEGMPISILEALAARRAVVATDVGAVAALIRNGETGLLIPPGDVAVLRESMLRLSADPGLRLRLGEAGCELVRRDFSTDVMARCYLEVYREVCGVDDARKR